MKEENILDSRANAGDTERTHKSHTRLRWGSSSARVHAYAGWRPVYGYRHGHEDPAPFPYGRPSLWTSFPLAGLYHTFLHCEKSSGNQSLCRICQLIHNAGAYRCRACVRSIVGNLSCNPTTTAIAATLGLNFRLQPRTSTNDLTNGQDTSHGREANATTTTLWRGPDSGSCHVFLPLTRLVRRT